MASYMDLIRQNGSFTPGSLSNINQVASPSMQAQAGSMSPFNRDGNNSHHRPGQGASRGGAAPPTGDMAQDLQGMGSWAAQRDEQVQGAASRGSGPPSSDMAQDLRGIGGWLSKS
ncbi:hypothetical protein FQN49_007068 [Arthroderma sp. PD_2]|nr:hypothetical protein FQN49_007068 [Arthroderma sp. PD_2]